MDLMLTFIVCNGASTSALAPLHLAGFSVLLTRQFQQVVDFQRFAGFKGSQHSGPSSKNVQIQDGPKPVPESAYCPSVSLSSCAT